MHRRTRSISPARSLPDRCSTSSQNRATSFLTGKSPALSSVSYDTIKAIEAREQESVQERKAKLLSLSQRCAERAWHLVEDKLTDDVKLGQAVMVAGIATDKVALLTAEQTQPTATLNVQVNLPDLYSEFIKVSQAIKQAVASDVTQPVTLQLADGDNDHQLPR